MATGFKVRQSESSVVDIDTIVQVIPSAYHSKFNSCKLEDFKYTSGSNETYLDVFEGNTYNSNTINLSQYFHKQSHSGNINAVTKKGLFYDIGWADKCKGIIDYDESASVSYYMCSGKSSLFVGDLSCIDTSTDVNSYEEIPSYTSTDTNLYGIWIKKRSSVISYCKIFSTSFSSDRATFTEPQSLSWKSVSANSKDVLWLIVGAGGGFSSSTPGGGGSYGLIQVDFSKVTDGVMIILDNLKREGFNKSYSALYVVGPDSSGTHTLTLYAKYNSASEGDGGRYANSSVTYDGLKIVSQVNGNNGLTGLGYFSEGNLKQDGSDVYANYSPIKYRVLPCINGTKTVTRTHTPKSRNGDCIGYYENGVIYYDTYEYAGSGASFGNGISGETGFSYLSWRDGNVGSSDNPLNSFYVKAADVQWFEHINAITCNWIKYYIPSNKNWASTDTDEQKSLGYIQLQNTPVWASNTYYIKRSVETTYTLLTSKPEGWDTESFWQSNPTEYYVKGKDNNYYSIVNQRGYYYTNILGGNSEKNTYYFLYKKYKKGLGVGGTYFSNPSPGWLAVYKN